MSEKKIESPIPIPAAPLLAVGETPECQLTAALARARAECPTIEKTRTAEAGKYSYDYADLADIMSAVVPALSRHGLAVTQTTRVRDDGAILLTTRVRHVGGGVEASEWPILFAETATPQQVGSAVTYARRYQYTAILGVQPAREDDDGAAASGQPGPTDNRRRAPDGDGPPADNVRRFSPAQSNVAGPPTAAQRGKLGAMKKDHGFSKSWLDAITLGTIGKAKIETAAECSKVIDAVEAELRAGPPSDAQDAGPPADAEKGV